jgi:hypothetical protein
MMNRKKPKEKELDPLYVIFEQHLFNFSDPEVDRKTFVAHVVVEYLEFLKKRSVFVPRSLESAIIEEIGSQVNTMLVKKIYGCLSLKDFQKGAPAQAKRRARKRYSRLAAA